jgi:hypothetical protein
MIQTWFNIPVINPSRHGGEMALSSPFAASPAYDYNWKYQAHKEMRSVC